jgi:hypothetical protein
MADDPKTEIASKLLDSVPTLLIILGTVLLILGLAGGITYNDWLPLTDLYARILAVLGGTALIGIGIFQSSRSSTNIPKSGKFGIKITSPAEGDHVDQLTVRGSIKKELPKGYVLKVLRFYPNNSYIPLVDAIVSLDKGTWEASGCSAGGNPGDTRYFTAHLVGPGGIELLNYYRTASNRHNAMREKLMKLTNAIEEYLPPITGKAPDMVECDRVKVYRS